MVIYSFDTYKEELIKNIVNHKGCYTGGDLMKWEQSSIVELEAELKNTTGKTYTQLTGNTVGF